MTVTDFIALQTPYEKPWPYRIESLLHLHSKRQILMKQIKFDVKYLKYVGKHLLYIKLFFSNYEIDFFFQSWKPVFAPPPLICILSVTYFRILKKSDTLWEFETISKVPPLLLFQNYCYNFSLFCVSLTLPNRMLYSKCVKWRVQTLESCKHFIKQNAHFDCTKHFVLTIHSFDLNHFSETKRTPWETFQNICVKIDSTRNLISKPRIFGLNLQWMYRS